MPWRMYRSRAKAVNYANKYVVAHYRTMSFSNVSNLKTLIPALNGWLLWNWFAKAIKALLYLRVSQYLVKFTTACKSMC